MLIALAGGLVVGLLIGMLGGGGAILSIPLLVYALGFSAQQATASSLVIVGAGALIGIIAQHKQKNVNLKKGVLFGFLGLLGSFIASKVVTGIDENLLLTLFAALLVLVALTMLLKIRQEKPSPHQAPRHLQDKPDYRVLPLLLTATGVGFLTGFFGVGGGFAIVPALTLVLGFSMQTAVGTSLVVILVNSLSALAFRAEGVTSVDWSIVGPFTLASVGGSLAGSVLMHRIPRTVLQFIFAFFLMGIAVFMGAQNIPSLIQ